MTITEKRTSKRQWTLPDPFLLTVLSFGTGFLDAVTYLGLDRIFGANMTGNLILVGIGVAGQPSQLIHPLVALVSFCIGSMIAGMCSKRLEARRTSSPAPSLLLLIAGCLLGASVLLAVIDVPGGLGLIVTALIGIAMGFQGLAARLLAVPEINTLVVTSTLSQFFAEVGSGRAWRKRAISGRQLLAISSMLLGAAVGAAVVPFAGLAALSLPCALVLMMSLFSRKVAFKEA